MIQVWNNLGGLIGELCFSVKYGCESFKRWKMVCRLSNGVPLKR